MGAIEKLLAEQDALIERLAAALASLDLGSVPESEGPAAVALRLTLMIQKAKADALSGTPTTSLTRAEQQEKSLQETREDVVRAARRAPGTPTTKRWCCESCGEWFDVETFSHTRTEDDGHGNPMPCQCGPISERVDPTTKPQASTQEAIESLEKALEDAGRDNMEMVRARIGETISILKGEGNAAHASTTAKLVPVERLREVRGTIEQLLCVQNGCPLPSYEEAFRLANMEAGKTLEWLATALREETVPPKPTPPPLREFREGDIPKKVRP